VSAPERKGEVAQNRVNCLVRPGRELSYVPWIVSHTIHETGFVNDSGIAKHALFLKPRADARYDEDAQDKTPVQTIKIRLGVNSDTTGSMPNVANCHQPLAA
jgi:hypothetical protein